MYIYVYINKYICIYKYVCIYVYISPAKCHARIPHKKEIVLGAPQKSKLALPYSSQLQGFLPSHTMIEIQHSEFIQDI